MKYLALDTESGGRDMTYSLLTVAFLVMTETFNVVDELYLELKPDNDAPYVLSGQGMGVNKINLQAHDAIALPYKQAKPLLFNFLKKNSNGERLVPIGHAVKGDINRVIACLISEGSWEQFCTYHYIDTSVVLQFLRACSKMPLDTDGSVSALAKYFNIDVDNSALHTAKYDTILTMEVFKKFIELGKK